MHFPPLRILDGCFGTGFLFYFLGDLSRGLLYVTLCMVVRLRSSANHPDDNSVPDRI